MIWPARSGVSGMRWRVWISVASRCASVVRHAGGAREEAADVDRVGGVVGALVDHLEHVGGPDHAGGDLHAAGAPAVGQRHLAAAERHLVAGNRHRLEDRAADHPLGLLVEVGEVVAVIAPPAASCPGAQRPATQHQLGLEVDVVRQLQVLHEARGLHVVAVVRARTPRPARARPAPRRARGSAARGPPAPSPSPCARAAEDQPVAARELRRRRRRALELVHHLALGHRDRRRSRSRSRAPPARSRPPPGPAGSRPRTGWLRP